MNKPIYNGISILDLSKLFMYNFHYNYMKKKYPGDKSILCFTDTDSLLYALKTDNMYADMIGNHQLFDFSDYPDSHHIFSGCADDEIELLKKKNKKVIGKMKDELKGSRMRQFAALKSKCYAFEYEEDVYINEKGEKVKYKTDTTKLTVKECKKDKGMKKSVVKRKMRFQHYKRTLFEGTKHYEEMKTFRSKKHKINTVVQNKLALSNYDDKRWICDDGVTTFAHGHKMIRTLEGI